MTDITSVDHTSANTGYILGLARDLQVQHMSAMTPCALRNIASLAANDLPLLDLPFSLEDSGMTAPECDALIQTLISNRYLIEFGNQGTIIGLNGIDLIEKHFQDLLSEPAYLAASDIIGYRTSGFEGPYGTNLLASAARAAVICRDKPETTQDYLNGIFPDITPRQWRAVFDALAYTL